ncbi:MAG: MATE family efflux transporter [Ruthenibacterium sp.]
MNERHMLRVFAKYTLMSVGGMLANSCYILADTFFVAQGLGTQGLAALNLAIPAYNFIYGTGLLLGMGGATRYAVCKSRGDARGADTAFTHALYLAALCAAAGAALGASGSGRLAALLGASGEVTAMAHTYLRVMLLFSPAFIFNAVLVCFVRNDGQPRLAMLSTVIGSFSNIVLDYIFIFPCGMGIFGAVLATGLAPVLGIALLLPHWFSAHRGFHARRLRPRAGEAGAIAWLGLPALLAQLSSGVVMITFNSIILRLEGSTGVAAYGVVANISLVAAAIYTGLGQGMQPLASRAWGEGSARAAHRLLHWAMAAVLGISAALSLGLFVFARPVAQAFNSENDAALLRIAVQGLRLYFSGAVFMGANIVFCTYFPAVEHALPAQVLSLLRGFILLVPLAFAMAAVWGMTGVWLAVPAAEAACTALGCALYARSRRRQPPVHR